MADFQMYHAMGDQAQSQPDPRGGSKSPSSYPPGSGVPAGDPRAGSPYAGQDGLAGSAYRSPSPYGYPGQSQSFVQPQGAFAGDNPVDGSMAGLAAQMGGLGVGDASAAASSRGGRKKHRHAHHNLETPSAASPSYSAPPYDGHVAPAGQPFAPAAQPQQGAAPFAPYSGAPASSPFLPPSHEPFRPAAPLPSPGVQTPVGAFGSGQGTSTQGRVDPDQIPSVPQSRDGPAHYYLDHVYPTLERHLPPPGAVPFLAHDQGNSSPKFARLTMNNIPSTTDFLASTGLPLGLLLQPLAPVQPGESPIPVLDFGEAGPPRCRRCRAYINPFMTFRSGGNRFVCNMCTFPNEVPNEYFAPVNQQGLRVDRDQRPELSRGTVEFMVPKEYWAKDPVGLRILFVIDVGQEAVNRAFLEGFCDGILAALYEREEPAANGADGEEASKGRSIPEGAKVGIMTFDKQMHFYNLLVSRDGRAFDLALMALQPGAEKPQMMVMPDIEDPFVPLSDGLFVDPYESRYVIELALLPRFMLSSF